MESGKCKFRKAFLRDVDIPLTQSKAKVINQNDQCATNSNKNTINWKPTDKKQRRDTQAVPTKPVTKFKLPELNTALNIRKQIDKVKNEQPAKAPTSIGELTPKSKKFVKGQITKKLNFQHDENVFKGLVPVNVNDSILIPTKKKPLKERYTAEAKRDPEPDLADFLRPIGKFNVPFEPYLPLEMTPRKPNSNNFDHILDVFAKIDVGA
ncbi:protein PPP1R35 homolog [Uranotaenia lowii]|uniref:protein PPP1R35 homolog n=1 Tax=Uranotaenia lowii TaxID=190385 RepID=UPI00247867B1|nr:protein PPP1R35 homolog [Uranotaenia lowii]